MSIINATETANMNGLPVHLDSGSPYRSAGLRISVEMDTKSPTAIVYSWPPLVLFVLRAVGFAQIAKSVVQRISVNVVNLVGRMLPRHVEPHKTVRMVVNVVNANGPSAALLLAPGYLAHLRLYRGLDAPREYSCLRVVMEQLAQTVCCKILGSHEARPLLIGQRPDNVRSVVRPCYCN